MLLHNIISRYLLSKENKINLGDFKNNLKNNEIIGLINFIISKIKKKTKNIKKKQILIAIYLPRNVWYISSIFATWLSGNYFVPLNQNWPKKQEKLRNINIKLPIQINGKTRGIIEAKKDISEEDLLVKINQNSSFFLM